MDFELGGDESDVEQRVKPKLDKAGEGAKFKWET